MISPFRMFAIACLVMGCIQYQALAVAPSCSGSIVVENLDLSEERKGWGEFYSLSKAPFGIGRYVLATSKDRTDKVVKVNGTVIHIALASTSCCKYKNGATGRTEMSWTETYIGKGIVRSPWPEEEGTTYRGRMRIKFNQGMQTYSVLGERGGD